MKYILSSILFLFLLNSCKEVKKDRSALPPNSIFNLSSVWTNQDGKDLQLKDLPNKTLVVVMIYTTCKSACPILVGKMKAIEGKFTRKIKEDIALVLVSIDPKTDTPEKLKAFAKSNGMVGEQWIFLRSTEEATQEFANVLAMKYKKISPIDFSHSNIISVFSADGKLMSQEEGNIDVNKVVENVEKVTNQ